MTRKVPVAWGLTARPKHGETASGDRGVVAPFAGGVLLGAVDGLGHGEPAAAAAERAVRVLVAEAGASVVTLVQRCHDQLLDTRGVVLSLATLSASEQTLRWLGVGNVEAVLLRADPAAAPPRQCLLLRGGVVGFHLPPLHETVVRVAAGDVLIFATDGIRREFAEEVPLHDPPQQIAERILRLHAKDNDDALVLVATLLKGDA